MKVNILGIQIDDLSLAQAVEVVERWVREGGKHYIVTPNPEFLVAAQKDAGFRKVLNGADLSIPDGAGLRLSGKITNTTPGVDLLEKLCERATLRGWKVGFLGGKCGAAALAAKKLQGRYQGLKVVFAEDGPAFEEGQIPNSKFQIPNPTTDVLFIAFGMGKQERWIVQSLDKVDSKVFMGVGGAFDYLSGRVPRAPKWLRALGLEWLFRLILQPWRTKRQLSLLRYLFLLLTDRSN